MDKKTNYRKPAMKVVPMQLHSVLLYSQAESFGAIKPYDRFGDQKLNTPV